MPLRVPDGVWKVHIEAVGGRGGESCCSTVAPGGRGAVAGGDAWLVPGSTVYVRVGENGHGGGSDALTQVEGGGGSGGTTDWRRNTTPPNVNGGDGEVFRPSSSIPEGRACWFRTESNCRWSSRPEEAAARRPRAGWCRPAAMRERREAVRAAGRHRRATARSRRAADRACSDPTGRARRGLPVVPDTAAAQEVPGRRSRRPSATGSGPGAEVGPAGTAVVGAPPGTDRWHRRGGRATGRRRGRTLPRAVGRHDRTVVAGFGARRRRHLRASLKGLPEQRSATGPYMRDSKSRQNVSAKSWLSPEK